MVVGFCCSNCNPILSNVTIKNNFAGDQGGGLWLGNSHPVFSTESRCNIYLNGSNNPGIGKDIFSYDDFNLTVIVDTFTVLNPTNLYACPLEYFTFDIQNGVQEQVNADVFVSPDGDDNNSGSTFEDPLKTIQYATSVIFADSLNPHTINLSEGTYSQSQTGEIFPIYLPSYVSLSGIDQDNVILDGETSTPTNARIILCEYSKNVTISNFKIFNANSGILCLYSNKVFFQNLTISNANFGIGCYYTNQIVFKNLTITECNTAISLDGSNPTLMVNSILRNNSSQANIHEYYPSSVITIAYSNIQNGIGGIENNNGTVNWLDGNIDADPLFVDPTNGNYHLTENSPCIDAGIAYFEHDGEVLIDLSEDDYYGAAPDMGAYEWQPIRTQ